MRKRNRTKANGEGWKNKRKDGKGYDVGLHVTLPDGTLKRKSTTRKTSAAADAWLTEQKASRNGGVVLTDENPALAVYLSSWLEDAVRGSVKDVTYLHYRRMAHNHIIPVIGDVKIKSLSARHIQRLYARKRDEGLAASTRRHIHVTLRKALSQAVAWKDIPSDPSTSVKPPRAPASESERGERIKPYSEDELTAIFEAARGTRLYALYRLAPATGLREQELCGLSWEDLKLPSESGKAGELRVRNAVVEKEHGFAIEGVKTKTSRRTVEVPAALVRDLKEHRRRQGEERLAAKTWADPNLVFTTTRGSLITRYRVGSYFRPLRERAGVGSEHQFRDFRHTFATLMFARDTHPKVVQRAMGHDSVKITLDIYSAWIPDAHRGYSEALEGVF